MNVSWNQTWIHAWIHVSLWQSYWCLLLTEIWLILPFTKISRKITKTFFHVKKSQGEDFQQLKKRVWNTFTLYAIKACVLLLQWTLVLSVLILQSSASSLRLNSNPHSCLWACHMNGSCWKMHVRWGSVHRGTGSGGGGGGVLLCVRSQRGFICLRRRAWEQPEPLASASCAGALRESVACQSGAAWASVCLCVWETRRWRRRRWAHRPTQRSRQVTALESGEIPTLQWPKETTRSHWILQILQPQMDWSTQ